MSFQGIGTDRLWSRFNLFCRFLEGSLLAIKGIWISLCQYVNNVTLKNSHHRISTLDTPSDQTFKYKKRTPSGRQTLKQDSLI